MTSRLDDFGDRELLRVIGLQVRGHDPDFLFEFLQWNTGHDAVSNGVVPSSPTAENAVALTMTAGRLKRYGRMVKANTLSVPSDSPDEVTSYPLLYSTARYA